MFLDWLFSWRGEWFIEGWDTFAGHSYPIQGKYRTEDAALRAAKKYLKELERDQPADISGGQEGMQDQVFARGPGGQSIRVLPGG